MNAALTSVLLLLFPIAPGEEPESRRADEPMAHFLCSSAPLLLCSSSTGFASALALHGDELFVARTGAGGPRPPADGPRVFVYRRSSDRWVSRGEIDPGESGGGGFGTALAAGRDVVAVGAPGQGIGGTVLIYERRKGTWSLAATPAPPAPPPGAG